MINNFEVIKQKISELTTQKTESNISVNQINEIEEEYSILFPQIYKMFLQTYSEIVFMGDVYFYSIEKLKGSLDGRHLMGAFYGIKNSSLNLKKQIECYNGRIPSCLIPIVELPGGDLLCLGISGDKKDKVFLWDHENEIAAYRMLYPNKKTTSVDDYWENTFLVANTFTEFINSLHIFNKKISKDTLAKIKVTLDEDFFKD